MTEPTDKSPLDDTDEQLDQYLTGDSSVSRHYRELPGAEVPAELDRLVLSQAHQAVKHRKSQRPAWVRWSAPFAVAASAVLALAIVIETGVRDEVAQSVSQRLPEHPQHPIETRLIEEPAPMHAEAPVQPEPKREEPRAVEMRMPAPAPDPAPASAPAQATRPAAPAYAPPPQALPRTRVADDAADTAKQEQVAKAAQSEASAGAAAREEREEERVAAQRAMEAEQNLAAAAPPTVDTRAPVLIYSRQISANMAPSPRIYLDPEEWLKDIRQLRKDNKQQEADHEWRRFRAAYPNHQVAENDIARETKK